MKTYLFIFLFFLLFNTQQVFAINTILSGFTEQIIYDGKWTFEGEWKTAGIMQTENFVIRVAHYGDFIYVLVDGLVDIKPDKLSDKATICFDTKYNKSKLADENDYCFIAVLGKPEPITLQGGHFTALNGNFKKISNHENLIAIAGISDQNDRYSKIPHISYEFRIPLEIIERTNQYGFYVSMFDGNQNKVYSNTETEIYSKIPSPSTWDTLVSPDKTLPEFETPIIISLISVSLLLIFYRVRNNIFYNIKSINN